MSQIKLTDALVELSRAGSEVEDATLRLAIGVARNVHGQPQLLKDFSDAHERYMAARQVVITHTNFFNEGK